MRVPITINCAEKEDGFFILLTFFPEPPRAYFHCFTPSKSTHSKIITNSPIPITRKKLPCREFNARKTAYEWAKFRHIPSSIWDPYCWIIIRKTRLFPAFFPFQFPMERGHAQPTNLSWVSSSISPLPFFH
jgi:hypothetical protein